MARLTRCPHCGRDRSQGCVLWRNGGYSCREPFEHWYLRRYLRERLTDTPLSTESIRGALGLRTAGKWLRRMALHGEVVNTGRGMWRRCEMPNTP
jgi:hypothetical protein